MFIVDLVEGRRKDVDIFPDYGQLERGNARIGRSGNVAWKYSQQFTLGAVI